jgi:hypothetical protein
MRSLEFNYARHRQRDIPLVPVSLRTSGKWSEVTDTLMLGEAIHRCPIGAAVDRREYYENHTNTAT